MGPTSHETASPHVAVGKGAVERQRGTGTRTAVFSVVDPRSMMRAQPSSDGVLNRSHMHGVHGSTSPQPGVGSTAFRWVKAVWRALGGGSGFSQATAFVIRS